MADPCYCPAYPFPHRPGGGVCRASGETRCPSCGAVLDDRQVTHVLGRAQTYYYPAEYDPVLLEECGRCGAVGLVL